MRDVSIGLVVAHGTALARPEQKSGEAQQIQPVSRVGNKNISTATETNKQETARGKWRSFIQSRY